jgi:hypothetical protein
MKIKSLPSPQAQVPQAAEAARVIKAKTNYTPDYSPAAPAAEAPTSLTKPQVAEDAGLSPKDESAEVVATKPLSPQYVELARKEKALRQRELALQAKERETQSAQVGKVSLTDIKADPFKYLNEAGVTYEQLTQQPQAATPQDELKAQIAKLEEKLSGFEKSRTEERTEEYNQALKVIEGDVNLLVDSDNAYETIKATGSQKQVVALIERVFKDEGVVLDVTEAAKLIEDKLADQTIAQVQKFSQLSKVKSKLAPAAPSEPAKQPESKGTSKTLTNAMGVSRPLSARERAILAFNNQLK